MSSSFTIPATDNNEKDLSYVQDKTTILHGKPVCLVGWAGWFWSAWLNEQIKEKDEKSINSWKSSMPAEGDRVSY